MSGDTASSGPQGLHVSFGVSMDDDGKLQAYVKEVSSKAFSDGLSTYVMSPDHIAHTAQASKVAKTYRQL